MSTRGSEKTYESIDLDNFKRTILDEAKEPSGRKRAVLGFDTGQTPKMQSNNLLVTYEVAPPANSSPPMDPISPNDNFPAPPPIDYLDNFSLEPDNSQFVCQTLITFSASEKDRNAMDLESAEETFRASEYLTVSSFDAGVQHNEPNLDLPEYQNGSKLFTKEYQNELKLFTTESQKGPKVDTTEYQNGPKLDPTEDQNQPDRDSTRYRRDTYLTREQIPPPPSAPPPHLPMHAYAIPDKKLNQSSNQETFPSLNSAPENPSQHVSKFHERKPPALSFTAAEEIDARTAEAVGISTPELHKKTTYQKYLGRFIGHSSSNNAGDTGETKQEKRQSLSEISSGLADKHSTPGPTSALHPASANGGRATKTLNTDREVEARSTTLDECPGWSAARTTTTVDAEVEQSAPLTLLSKDTISVKKSAQVDDGMTAIKGVSGRVWPSQGVVDQKQEHKASFLRGFWEKSVHKIENSNVVRSVLPGKIPRWRSTDALTASLVASHGTADHRRGSIGRLSLAVAPVSDNQTAFEGPPKLDNLEKERDRTQTEREKEPIRFEAMPVVNKEPWFDRNKIKQSISRESIANLGKTRGIFEQQIFESNKFEKTNIPNQHAPSSKGSESDVPSTPPYYAKVQLDLAQMEQDLKRHHINNNNANISGNNVSNINGHNNTNGNNVSKSNGHNNINGNINGNNVSNSNGYNNTNGHINGNSHHNSNGGHTNGNSISSISDNKDINISNGNGHQNLQVNGRKLPSPPVQSFEAEFSREQQLFLHYIKDNLEVLNSLGIAIPGQLRQHVNDLPQSVCRVELKEIDDHLENSGYNGQSLDRGPGRYIKNTQVGSQKIIARRLTGDAVPENRKPYVQALGEQKAGEGLIAAEIRVLQEREDELKRSRSELGLPSLEDTIHNWRYRESRPMPPLRGAQSTEQLHIPKDQQQQQQHQQQQQQFHQDYHHHTLPLSNKSESMDHLHHAHHNGASNGYNGHHVGDDDSKMHNGHHNHSTLTTSRVDTTTAVKNVNNDKMANVLKRSSNEGSPPLPLRTPRQDVSKRIEAELEEVRQREAELRQQREILFSPDDSVGSVATFTQEVDSSIQSDNDFQTVASYTLHKSTDPDVMIYGPHGLKRRSNGHN